MASPIPEPGDHFVAPHHPLPLTVGELHLSSHDHVRHTREYLVTALDGSRWVLRGLGFGAADAEIRWLGVPAA